jgi:protein gp37
MSCLIGGRNTENPWHLNWVIVGGESGKGARIHNLQWSRGLIEQCKAAGVAVFEKQLGSAPYSPQDRITHRGCKEKMPAGFSRYLNHSKGGDWNEWPEDLRVREFPNSREMATA